MVRARPEDWYTTAHKGDDVTLIAEPFIHEFYRCNMWHVRGRDRDMLVDSGMGVVPLREWVPLVTTPNFSTGSFSAVLRAARISSGESIE